MSRIPFTLTLFQKSGGVYRLARCIACENGLEPGLSRSERRRKLILYETCCVVPGSPMRPLDGV